LLDSADPPVGKKAVLVAATAEFGHNYISNGNIDIYINMFELALPTCQPGAMTELGFYARTIRVHTPFLYPFHAPI